MTTHYHTHEQTANMIYLAPADKVLFQKAPEGIPPCLHIVFLDLHYYFFTILVATVTFSNKFSTISRPFSLFQLCFHNFSLILPHQIMMMSSLSLDLNFSQSARRKVLHSSTSKLKKS